MLRKIDNYIKRNGLLSGEKPVLVGLSGGADSVALLDILSRLGYPCVALHCNFHLRGEEADRDEAFARRFAESKGVPFYKVDFDTVAYAKERHLSIEMAARELRYAWFERERERLGGQAIAVAHHRDDNAETALMNLLRGSGIRGLGGMRPKNGFIVRPLLSVSRSDILAWLAEQGLGYVTDSTNLSEEYTRNFIRLRVLPLLEEVNPSASAAIARSAEHLAEATELYDYALRMAGERVLVADGKLSIAALREFPAPATLLYELLKAYGFTRQVVEEVFASLDGESGKRFYSVTHRLVKDRAFLLVEPLPEKRKGSASYQVYPPVADVDSPIALSFQLVPFSADTTIPRERRVACLDYDKLRLPLTLRHWREGDWFIPFGMRGRKKLSDYFSDRKYSLPEKERAWLLCDGETVVWLVGERIDNRFRVDKSTKRMLMVFFLI